MDPAKLKVVELRAELSKRGLDSKGNKPVLVERLRLALEEEQASGGAPPAEASGKSEKGSESEEDSAEPVKLPPRTPSRSSRHTSREPTTPVRTPTRRSSSRSSLSRQSPAKTMMADVNEAANTLEAIVEEDKESPKKESPPVATTPKKDAAPAPLSTPSPKKEVSISLAPVLIPSPKKESVVASPKKEEAPVCPPTPKKDASPIVAKKENIVQNESPKNDEHLEIVKEAEKHVVEKSQEITRVPAEEFHQASEKANQSPVKSVTLSPVKTVTQSPAKPADSDNKSPVKFETKSPLKPAASPDKQSTESNEDSTKLSTPEKVQQSPEKQESPNKKLKSNDVPKQTEKCEESEEYEEQTESMEVDQDSADKTSESDEQHDKDDKSNERKRKRSPSPIPEDAPRAPPIARPENEPNYDEDAVLLSWYDSDLNLVINTINYFSASPMQGEGFNYMWAGARVSHGFTKGKVFYEARINTEFDNLAAQSAAGATNASGALPVDEEKIPSILRVGWSTIGTSLQLGESKLSYGYEGTGKKAMDGVFEEYGKTFAKDDVVGCYADFETEDGTVILTYTVNGESQGPAFVIQKNDLEDKPLFPHVLSKNCSFTLNLGQEEPWSSDILEGYQSIGKVDLSDRVAGPRRPAKRDDCEVILLCGLPFSGKTSWASKHVAENPDKLYTVLGTHNLIEKMKVEGVPFKDKFKGRWETVEEKCTRALIKLLESAPSRRRNYILDQQANVYGSAQRRKMRNFYGFHRKAVVLVPSDEELQQRINKCKEESGGIEIRESSLLEVKANISAPTVGESFEEVVWAELDEEEGKKLIETYNKEGKTAGYGNQQQQPNKRSRFDNGQKDRNNRDNRDHRRPGGFNDRRSGSWRGGGGGGGGQGGWRDNRMRGPARHGGSGYGAPGAWRGRGGDRRQDDRRQGNDRNRSRQGWNSANYQQSWGNQGSWQGQAQGWSNQGWGQQQQQAWRGAGGAWKGYGQQQTAAYSQQQPAAQSYGNGNWNWGSQYYNNQQYWSGQQQQQGAQSQHTTAGQTSGQVQQSSGTQAASKK